MGVQRRYKGVEGMCRRVRGYMGVQRRYKGVEGICRRLRVFMGTEKTIQGSRYFLWEYKAIINEKTV